MDVPAKEERGPGTESQAPQELHAADTKFLTLKNERTVSRDRFGFYDMLLSSRPKQGTRPVFNFLVRCSNDFINTKSICISRG